MTVRKMGTKYVVYEGEGTEVMVSMHRCKAEAEAADEKHKKSMVVQPPSTEEVKAEEPPKATPEPQGEGENIKTPPFNKDATPGPDVTPTILPEPDTTPVPPVVVTEEPDGFACDQCDFVAKNLSGLSSHKRIKHPVGI